MEDPQKVYDNLKQLLTELQKVKDLNNLANEYKTISANLVLSLQDYLNDSRAFSDAFNNYLLQTNKSTENTKEALNSAIRSMNNAISTFSIADGTLDSKTQALIGGLKKLEAQATAIENQYNQCLSMKREIDTRLSNLKEQISQANNPVIEQLITLETKVETIDRDAKQLEEKIQSLGNNMSRQITQSKNELIAASSTNKQSMGQHANNILAKVDSTRSLQKVTIGLLTIILVLVTALILMSFYNLYF